MSLLLALNEFGQIMMLLRENKLQLQNKVQLQHKLQLQNKVQLQHKIQNKLQRKLQVQQEKMKRRADGSVKMMTSTA